jgi:ribonuclease D
LENPAIRGGDIRIRRLLRKRFGPPAAGVFHGLRHPPETLRGADDMTITLHQGDLPADIGFGPAVAIDTETLGLNPHRDRLCLVQLSAGDGAAHLVQISAGKVEAPNLARLLADPSVLKIFHYARFDIAVLENALGVMATPVFCTKIASKLVRTYTDRHGLKDLTRELLGIELSKQQQSSDWGAAELSKEQLAYAASDVLHLHALKDRLVPMLEREGRGDLAEACFRFLPARARLDLGGWADLDIFSH